MYSLLLKLALNNRVLVLLLLLLACIGMGLAIPKLKLDAFPDVTNTQVEINTQAPGLAAEEVEQLITYPIESVMYTMPDVVEVRSISKTGLSGVTVVFTDGMDIYRARQLVFERLESARGMLPDNIATPQMGPNTSGLGQVFQYLLVTDAGHDTTSLRSLNDYLVKPMLMPIDGITDVLSFGGEVLQYQVNLDPNKMLSFGVTQAEVVTALEQNNVNAGGWYLNRGQEQLVIRGTGWFSSLQPGLDEVKQVPIKYLAGRSVTVQDVASVEIGGEIRQGAVTMSRRGANDEVKSLGEVVTGVVLKRLGANSRETIEGIYQVLPKINRALPPGVRLEPYYEQANLINQAVNTVVQALVLALVLILVVLMLFLLNLNATLLVLISIPISIGLALSVMSVLGMSANLMSLGGLAVAIGLLVDGSVVMVEAMLEARLEERQTPNGDSTLIESGERDNRAQLLSVAKQMGSSVFFAVCIIILVFLPLFSFEGVEARLFQPMAVSIILALIFALLTALFLVPVLASLMLRQRSKPRVTPFLQVLDSGYRACLVRLLPHAKVVLLLAFALFISSLALLAKLGTEFVPELEEGTLNLRATLAPNASLETALEVAPKLEQLLMRFPEVEYTLSRIGRGEIGGDPEPVNNIEIYIGLKPVDLWQSADDRLALQAMMEVELSQFPGVLYNFSQPIATRVDELLSGVKAELAIKLLGPDLNILHTKGKEIEALVAAVPGATGVAMEQLAGEAQLVIVPKRHVLSQYGLSVADLMSWVRDGLGGRSAGQIISDSQRSDIYVRLAPEFRRDKDAIANIWLATPSGAWVRFGDVADIEFKKGPPQIRRDRVQRRVVIQANVAGRDMGSLVAEIQQVLEQKLRLPPGYSLSYGGQFESQQRALARLAILVPLSLGLIALLLFMAFDSVRQMMVIILCVPMAAVGGIGALYLSGHYLSVPSSVGFITLFGIAVLNGVVLVQSINKHLRCVSEIGIEQAVIAGAANRLRPVLMTALTTGLGLLPVLLSSGLGAEIQKPLATVIIGGLGSATLLTLFVIPLAYGVFCSFRGDHVQEKEEALGLVGDRQLS